MVTFEESDMTFSFDDRSVYRIEKSATLNAISGCKSCECIVFLRGKVFFIEAKQSSPRTESKERFLEFIEEISTKFSDSFSFFHSVHLHRHPEEHLPEDLQHTSLCYSDYQFFLIINGHPKEWLPPLQDQLKKSMRKMLRIWGIKDVSVKVINDQIARSYGLIA